ncbi:metallophosphoesterase family protein [Aminomonas paucivorans]|uniref:Calcineurin-like phosphoesterase domain-containing protein n=1 Tax=Aminomonas paucivorans DSM 12260 TaxID=584708 RepID=E3CXJ2_9BACT|nr:metallophosphoesterase [Aminomonas paucivorans]EFQ24436.1 conserved hypothetical protein [Aminomonas paucivorans DSM 12260]
MGRFSPPDVTPYDESAQRSRERLDRLLTRVGFLPPALDGSGCLLHVSDTPSSTYGYLRRVLQRIRPLWLVHTGDVADEIKLELWPNSRDCYRDRVRKLARILREEDVPCIVAAGNHDDPEILEDLLPCRRIIRRGETLDLGPLRIRLGHYYRDVAAEPEAVNLFGHDLTRRSGEENGRLYLNGLEHMHLVDLVSREVTRLPYPGGTDDERMLRRRRRM